MNTEQLTKLASFAGKSANDFWMSTGKKPTDVIAELALSLIEANGKVQAMAAENEEMRKIIDAVTDLDNEPQYHEQGIGCGIEDRGYQRDGYRACQYGWDEAMERIYSEVIPCAEGLSFPATGAAVAQIEAQGVDKAIVHLTNKFSDTGRIGVPVMALEWLAKELREAK